MKRFASIRIPRLQAVGLRISTAIARKRALADRARVLAHRLEPGIWTLAYPGLLVHWRTLRLPVHLRRTKGRTRRRLRQRLSGLARAVIPPMFVFVSGREAGSGPDADALHGGAPFPRMGGVLFVAPPGREATVVDTRGRVARIAIEGSVPVRVEAIRRAMQLHVPMPSFEVSADRSSILETFVDGPPFIDLDSSARSEAFASLLASYTRLVTHGRRSPRPKRVAAAFDAAIGERPEGPARLWIQAERDEAVRAARLWPCTPSHGDVWSGNLVAVEGELHLIDFELADLMPFFYDIASFVLDEASYGRTDLLDGIRPGGRFHDGWQELWRAAGLPRLANDLGPILTTTSLLYARTLDRRKSLRPKRPLLERTLHLLPPLKESVPSGSTTQ